eukprot:1148501-Pelagomonas_calceolata.AAC.3
MLFITTPHSVRLLRTGVAIAGAAVVTERAGEEVKGMLLLLLLTVGGMTGLALRLPTWAAQLKQKGYKLPNQTNLGKHDMHITEQTSNHVIPPYLFDPSIPDRAR